MSGALRPGGPRLRDLAELRFLLAWRRLRGRGGLADGIAQLLLFVVAIPAALGFAVLVGFAVHRAALVGRGLQATVTLGAVLFGIWQTWTMVGIAITERDGLDLRRLLLYPVHPGRAYALGLGTSLAGDPFAAFWLVVLGGILAGAAVARPGAWLLLLAAVLAAFALATVALVALAQEVLGRLARSRRWRELAVAAGVLGWVALVAAGSSDLAALRTALSVLRRLRWALYPAALATEAAGHLFARRPLAALPWLALLLAAGLVTAWAAYRAALWSARSGAEAGVVAPSRGGRAGRLFPERLGPLFEKELRYLMRHPAARLHLVMLPFLAAFLAWKVAPRLDGEAAPLLRALPLLGLGAYVHLALQLFWVNALGFDRGGARALFLAPLAPHAVLAAKNGALLAWALLLFAAAAGAYLLVGGPQPWWAMAGGVVLVVGLAPLLYGLGNLLSVAAPRPASHGLQRSGAVSPLAALAGMAITSAAVALYAAPVLAALWLDALWVVPVAWGALAAASFAAWRATLPAAGRFLARRREAVLAAVCGDEA